MYICPYIFTGLDSSIITMEIQAGTVRLGRTFIMKLSSDLNQTMARFHQLLDVQTNFDIVYHTLTIGGKQALIYFVDGLTKDEVLLRIMQGFASIQRTICRILPTDSRKNTFPMERPAWRMKKARSWSAFSSGLSCLLIDGYDKCITIDCRTYPGPRRGGAGKRQGAPGLQGRLCGDPDL